MRLCIGLFGTCGSSRWRDPFIDEYRSRGIEFFNPQLPPGMWSEETSPAEEAEHLAEDMVILFPITSETYALGSLSEVGFSILHAISLDDRRAFVVMIDRVLGEGLNDSEARQGSLRARELVYQHLKELRLSNLFLVDTLKEMLDVSLWLWETARIYFYLSKYNPHLRTWGK